MFTNIRVSNFIKSGSAIFCILCFLPTVAGSQSWVNILIQQLEDENPTVRARASRELREKAATNLEEIKNANVVETLILLTRKGKNTDVRQRAAGVLGEIDDARSIETLMTGLKELDLVIVGGAYRFFIRKGEPGSEDVLISALFAGGYFNDEMAKAFINSGSSKLQKAGREWAESHGYKIFMGPFNQ